MEEADGDQEIWPYHKLDLIKVLPSSLLENYHFKDWCEITHEIKTALRFQSTALEALQETSEIYLIGLF